MLLLCGQRPHTAGNHHLHALEEGLLEEGIEPGLELFVEVVEEDGAGRGDCRNIGGGRLVQLAVPARPDDGLDVDMIAADVGEHVGDNTECRDHRDPLRRSRRPGQQQDGKGDNATQRQAFRPSIGAARRNVPAAPSERPNSNPAINTIAGPEGRLP